MYPLQKITVLCNKFWFLMHIFHFLIIEVKRQTFLYAAAAICTAIMHWHLHVIYIYCTACSLDSSPIVAAMHA